MYTISILNWSIYRPFIHFSASFKPFGQLTIRPADMSSSIDYYTTTQAYWMDGMNVDVDVDG
jgi:hypothetical protein